MNFQHLKQISSKDNALAKTIAHCRRRSYRKETQLFAIEGVREVTRALMALSLGEKGKRIHPPKAKITLEALILCPELFASDEIPHLLAQLEKIDYPGYRLPQKLFAALSQRETPDGVLMLAKSEDLNFNNWSWPKLQTLLVAQSIEKPGNLGALIRTTDSSGAQGLILCDSLVDPYHPNVIRSSQGAVFHLPIAQCTTQQCLDKLTQASIRSIITSPHAPKPYWDIDFSTPLALWVGNEHQGLILPEFSSPHNDQKNHCEWVRIPMRGISDSLNVSTATAVVLYEILRQRAKT